MEIIKAKDIYLEYDGKEILDIEELTVYEGERIGLVGSNGSGKTSLLNILAGKIKNNAGEVNVKGEIALIVQNNTNGNIEIGEMDYFTSILEVNNKNYENFSGGEQTRYRIAQALGENSRCILADEPTSHLDRNGIDLLIRELDYFSGAMIIVSHDSKFLDAMVHKIWEIKDKGIREYYGNYSDYLEEKRFEEEQEQKAYELYQDEKFRLEKAIEIKKKQASDLNRKSHNNKTLQGGRLSMQRPTGSKEKSLNKVAKNIEKRLENLEEITPPRIERDVIFRQSKEIKLHNNYPIIGDKINKKLGDKILFENASITIPLSSKVAIVGDNGVGKTTLLKMILEKDISFTIASKVRIAYFQQQNYISSSKETVMEFLQKDSDYKSSELIAMLVQMGFEKDYIKKSLCHLSGGEFTKIILLKIFSGQYNVILMDEPSTFLDNHAVIALEKMMKEYKGTIIFVTHDTNLIQNVADIVYEIKNKKVNRKNMMKGFK